jgi:NitT/TauT family transport system ATP-binding protein
VGKTYDGRRGPVEALRDVDLQVAPGEFVSLVGPSGCGKTTLLRILAGLLAPSRGEVMAGGRPVRRDGRRDDEACARFGLVFQDAHLFPWYSVVDNIALPLRLRGMRRRARAAELCRALGLAGFERSHVRELSGGMRQRAALARALIADPSVLFMDEPFGALDALTRDRMNLDLQALHAATGTTVVLVTHAIAEAVLLADRVVLLTPRPGRIRSVTTVTAGRPRPLDDTDTERLALVARLRQELDEEDT